MTLHIGDSGEDELRRSLPPDLPRFGINLVNGCVGFWPRGS